jgi:hypothetical protein
MPRRRTILHKLGVLVLLCIGLPGCAGIGPNRLERDLLPYASAISDSQKRQILLNIVRLRYGDTPTFLSVNQVLASYTLEQRGELGFNLFPNAGEGNAGTGLGEVTFSDRPTITFAPLSGERLSRTAIRPPSPAEFLPLAQGGMPIDVLFRLGVQSIGPLRNTVILGGEEGAGDPQFFELLTGMRRLQVAGLLTVRFVGRKDSNQVFLGITNGSDQELQAVVVRVRRLLGMTPGETQAEVVYGSVSNGPHQIAIVTRPIMAALSQVGAEIEVPRADVEAGRTISSSRLSPFGLKPIVTVHSGSVAPSDAEPAVTYRGSWFWIDENDFNSKVAYNILVLLIAVANAAPAGQGPVLAIPTG